MIIRRPLDDDARDQEIRETFDELLGGIQPGLGHALEQKDRPEEALPLFREIVERHPDDAWAWYNLGDTLLALGRDDEARTSLLMAIRLNPGVALFHYDLGLTYFNQKRWEEAVGCFSAVAKIDPQMRRARMNLGPSALNNLALAQGELGFWDQAMETLQPCLKETSKVLYNLGRFALRARDFRKAEHWLTLAAQLSPDSEDILHGVGSALMGLEKWSLAEPYLARAVIADPKCRDAWYDRGVCLAKEGKPENRPKARRYFETAFKLDPRHAWSQYDLACLDALDGKIAAAFRHLTHALDLGLADRALPLQDPDLRSLRGDARWAQVAERLRS